jgi:hypothetical protein
MKVVLTLAVAAACGAGGYFAATPTTHLAPFPTPMTIPPPEAAGPSLDAAPRECNREAGVDSSCSFN